ncbi:unnamed protein product [Oikopleura dioica]|uniref:Peptidase S1 domain-containing protein n=1 Tax=Oikopleura dioica TaxID=34765 RepID=E4Y495_OIKDI|nr:unnamed protein product [Oikopleura dioica]
MKIATVFFGAAFGDYYNTIYDEAGTLSSVGYPGGYTKSEQWKFKTPGAQKFTFIFEDIDIDPDCYSYVSVYDGGYSPTWTLCDHDTGRVIHANTSQPQIYLQKTYGVIPPGKRGIKFQFYINDQLVSTTTTTTEGTTTSFVTAPQNQQQPPPPPPPPPQPPNPPFQITPISLAIQRLLLTPPPVRANFPPGDLTADESCSNTAFDPIIDGFDYVAQDRYVRNGESARFSNERVVNGEEAVPHSFPWQAGIGTQYNFYCGGTVVAPNWVATAAHCGELVFIGSYSSDVAVAGAHDYRNDKANQQSQEIKEVFMNPNWEKRGKQQDVCMLKLKGSYTFNDFIQPACLAHKDWALPDGFLCVVSGWGMTSESSSGAGSPVLRQAALNYMNDDDCHSLYKDGNGLLTSDDMQCFGTRPLNPPKQGACNGDSGGPLHCFIHGKWYYSGIVSFGASKCDTNIASVYGKVYNYKIHDFIIDTMEQNP